MIQGNNLTIYIGRLTRDPDIAVTPNGVKRARVGIAVDRPKNANGERLTDFFDGTAWRNTAEFLERYCHKGDSVQLMGAMHNSNYTDQNGNKVKRDDFTIESVQILSRPAVQNNLNEQQYSGNDFVSQTAQNEPREAIQPSWNDGGFGNPLGIRDEDLPF